LGVARLTSPRMSLNQTIRQILQCLLI
jgi:hypothetical protein